MTCLTKMLHPHPEYFSLRQSHLPLLPLPLFSRMCAKDVLEEFLSLLFRLRVSPRSKWNQTAYWYYYRFEKILSTVYSTI